MDVEIRKLRRPGVGNSREFKYEIWDKMSSTSIESFPSIRTVVASELTDTSVPGSSVSLGGSCNPSLHRWRHERTSGFSLRPRRTDKPAKYPRKWWDIFESRPSQQAPTTRVVLTPRTEWRGQSSTISGLEVPWLPSPVMRVSLNICPSM